MFGLGAGELFIILLIIIFVFGLGKLPNVGADLVRTVKNFKKAATDKGESDKTVKKVTAKEDSDKDEV
ncbi:MAG: twin-arginine translocase TatA/TatE family subunit [Desulfobacteraceae bacterium]|nr:MAG: twin-arginine translocase TatA/TatE family subunit [Desulfobacteraceae bacterium]